MVDYDTGVKYAWGKLLTALKCMCNVKYNEAVFEQNKTDKLYKDNFE